MSGPAIVTGWSSVSPQANAPPGADAEPFHGKSSPTGCSVSVVRIHAGPAFGPTRNEPVLSVVQPGGRATGRFLTAHSKAHSAPQRKLSFQSPSAFMSTSTLR